MTETVVITGATSFLGKNVLKRLLDCGYNVYAFVRNKNAVPYREGDNFHIISGSLDDVERIKHSVKNADYFIHFAWDGSGNKGRADHEIQFKNVGYSMRALQIADSLGCKKFIFPGSQAEYGIIKGLITENSECRPVSEYGKAKLAFSEEAEKFCENADIDFIHLRIFSVYGYGDRSGTLVDLCVRGFNAGEKIQLGPCCQLWNYLYINDFADIILRLLKCSCDGGIYNVASEDTRILRDYVTEIYKLSNKSGECLFGETASNPEGSPNLEPSVKKLTDAIGDISYTSFEDGIRSMMNLLKSEV